MPKKKREHRQNGNGEGSVRLMPNGKYKAEIAAVDKDGGRKRFCFTHEDKQIALATVHKRREDWRAGALLSPDSTTVDRLAMIWYEELEDDVSKGKLERSTYDGYKYTKDIIVRLFAGMALSDATVEKIETKLDEAVKQDGTPYSMSQQTKTKVMLGQVFNRAVAKGLIKYGDNPMLSVKDLRDTAKRRREKTALKLDEVQMVINNYPDTIWGHALVVEMLTGLRRQEMIPLLRSDVEPDGSAISVNKAVKIKKGGNLYLGDPKTENSTRLVYLPKVAWPHARWLREHARNEYVFYSESTKAFCHPSTYSRGISSAVKSIEGVRNVTTHELRHTFARLGARDACIDSATMMMLTGHADKKVFEHYADHVFSAEKQDAANKINAVLVGTRVPKSGRTPTTLRRKNVNDNQ